jgi:hypothetical protein
MRFEQGMLIVFALFGAACGREKAVDATPADAERARALCQKSQDYRPGEGAEVLRTFDTYCGAASGRCPSRKNIAELCSFYGPRTSQRYDVHTTLSKDDTGAREQLCQALRESKSVGTVSEVRIFCADSKSWCTICRQGSGGHR